jgi:hypothetical protein
MKTLLPNFIFALCISLLSYLFPITHAYAAPSLLLAPTSVSTSQNQTFSLTLSINVDANHVKSSDTILTYAGADLEVSSVTTGGFFPNFSYANDANGLLEIHGFNTLGESTGSGTLATIAFKTKASQGSSSITITCTGGTTNTNILTTTAQNILSCSRVNQTGVTYESSSSTLTPTPTRAAGGGNNSPICASMYTDISSAVGSPLTVAFTCTGVDTDGYVNAVEFTFGDGTKQLVEKNIGSPGSLATTHTYTTIGALGSSCRVRDNNGIYSSTPDICKKIITIKPKTGSSGTTQPGSQKGALVQGTPPLLAIISDTPEPTPEPTIPPITETPIAQQSMSGNSRIWWIIGGGIALIIAFILLRRRRPGNPPQSIPPMNPPTNVEMPQNVEV